MDSTSSHDFKSTSGDGNAERWEGVFRVVGFGKKSSGSIGNKYDASVSNSFVVRDKSEPF